MEQICCNSFSKGLRDGIPIGLGYLSVSFTFGMMAVTQGIPVWGALLISMTNLTSAGQVAGLSLILTGGSLIEMALTQLVINLRYALMSLSLSQKLNRCVSIGARFMVSFGNTDEIFAVNMQQKGELGTKYMLGLMVAPYFGWTLGTLIGGVASTFLPESIRSALGIAIYGMFLAIIIPPSKTMVTIRQTLLISILISCLFYYLPILKQVSSGFVIIICTLVASGFMAWFAPIDIQTDSYSEKGVSADVN